MRSAACKSYDTNDSFTTDTHSVCVISALRLWLLHEAQNDSDLTKMNVRPVTWSSLEINLAIITSSLPTLKPLVLRLFPRFGSSTNSRTTPHGNPVECHRIGAVHSSTFDRSLPTSRSVRTLGNHKNTRGENDAWEAALEEGTHHGVAYRTEVEARRESRQTPPGKIHVATTRTVTHDDESAISVEVFLQSDDGKSAVRAGSASC